MNDLGTCAQPSRAASRRRGVGSLLLAGLVCVMAVAFATAVGTARASGLGGVSAAQDQYGTPGVLTPPSTTTTPTPTTPAPTPAGATKVVTTPTSTVGTPAAKTLTSPPTNTTPTTTSGAPAPSGVTLPFTGLSIFKVMLVGIGLIALGFVLRRRRRVSGEGK